MITLAADSGAPASPARWREAVHHHAARTPVPRSTWDTMEISARQRAFTVSGITSAQLLSDVHGAIDRALANGTTLRDFKREMESRLTAEWGAPNAARVETIFRTNVQTAYNAGRHAQMSQPTAMALRPYWAFQAILDKRTTDTCSPLDKVTRPVGDAFWDSHWPPLHFNCRSTVTSLSRREFDRLAASPTGVKTEAVHPDGRPVKPPLPGFGATPDLAGANLRPPRTTPPDVQRAYDARNAQRPTAAVAPPARPTRPVAAHPAEDSGPVTAAPGQPLPGRPIPAQPERARSDESPSTPVGDPPPLASAPHPFRPTGTPVSGALNLDNKAMTRVLRPVFEQAIAAIDRVHGDGVLERIPVMVKRGKKNHGEFNYLKKHRAQDIRISRDTPYPRVSLFHEVGHYLDSYGFFAQSPGAPASDGSMRLAPLRALLGNSAPIQHLTALTKRTLVIGEENGNRFQYRVDQKYVGYLLRPQEQFCRAYSQYITLRGGDTVAQQELAMLQRRQVPIDYPEHWSAEDFEPIAAEFDRLFREQRWITPL